MINPLENSGLKVILASKSPRRHHLLEQIGIPFEIRTKEVEESYPDSLKKHEIAVYLAEKKAKAMFADLANDELLITADTIVWKAGAVMGKPANKAEAKEMLQNLSGGAHRVYTGVCLRTKDKEVTFWAKTKVYFCPLREEEIDLYLDQSAPFDKAGSYGIQDWIGYIGVEYIEGSYFNVMGLPTQRLYSELTKFVTENSK